MTKRRSTAGKYTKNSLLKYRAIMPEVTQSKILPHFRYNAPKAITKLEETRDPLSMYNSITIPPRSEDSAMMMKRYYKDYR